MKTRLFGIIIVGIMVTMSFGITVNAQVSYWREESAWGEGDGFPGKSWAMYFSYTMDSGIVETDLIADFDEYLDIGNVTVWNDADSLFVEFEVFDGWQLNETHVDVAVDGDVDGVPDFPINKGGNPKVGKFSYKNETHCLYQDTTFKYTITKAWSTGITVYIAAHAEVAISLT